MVLSKKYMWLIGVGILAAVVSISVALYFTQGDSDDLVEDHCTTEITSSCEPSKGKCISTESTWKCDCKPGYGNPAGDTKSCEDLPCGRHTALSAEVGELEMPDTTISDTYPNNVDCSWDITTSAEKTLALKFTKFSLEYSTSCDKDYLQFMEESDQRLFTTDIFCGDEKPGKDGVYLTNSNYVRLRLRSNYNIANKGFKLTWSSVEKHCINGDMSTCEADKGYCVSGLDWKCECYPGFDHPSGDTKACDGVECGIRNQISAEEGTLEYPAGDNTFYADKKKCTWTLTTTPGKVLTLTFTEFDTEDGILCEYDYLEIHDGSIPGPAFLDKFCGTTLPGDNGVYNTTLNKLRLIFYADSYTNCEGFKLAWTSD